MTMNDMSFDEKFIEEEEKKVQNIVKVSNAICEQWNGMIAMGHGQNTPDEQPEGIFMSYDDLYSNLTNTYTQLTTEINDYKSKIENDEYINKLDKFIDDINGVAADITNTYNLYKEFKNSED